MNLDPKDLYLVDEGWSYWLLSSVSWDVCVHAGSREEMEMKLAILGLEADWEQRLWFGNRRRVRRIRT